MDKNEGKKQTICHLIKIKINLSSWCVRISIEN